MEAKMATGRPITANPTVQKSQPLAAPPTIAKPASSSALNVKNLGG